MTGRLTTWFYCGQACRAKRLGRYSQKHDELGAVFGASSTQTPRSRKLIFLGRRIRLERTCRLVVLRREAFMPRFEL